MNLKLTVPSFPAFRRSNLAASFALAVITCLSGCGSSPEIRIASWSETEQIIAQNEGQVVVIDLWATW